MPEGLCTAGLEKTMRQLSQAPDLLSCWQAIGPKNASKRVSAKGHLVCDRLRARCADFRSSLLLMSSPSKVRARNTQRRGLVSPQASSKSTVHPGRQDKLLNQNKTLWIQNALLLLSGSLGTNLALASVSERVCWMFALTCRSHG